MNRQKIIIFSIVFTNLLGAGVVVPTLPLFAEGRFGATATETGVFVSLYFVTQFFAAPIMGQMSDKFGRKPILVWSQVGTILSFLLFIFSTELTGFFNSIGLTILGGGFVLLSFARALDGITGGNITAAQAYITDISEEKDHANSLGNLQVAFACGIIFGPALGGALSQFGLLVPFVGAAVITTISLLATIFLLPESLPVEMRQAVGRVDSAEHQQPAWSIWLSHMRSEIVLMLLGLALVVQITIAGLSAIFPLFAQRLVFSHLPDTLVARNVGFMMAYIGIAAVLSQVLINRHIIARFGEQNAIIISIVAAGLTCIGLSVFEHPLLLTLALTPAGFAYTIGIPSGEALLIRNGESHARGQLMGLYNAATSLGYAIGPVIAGFLFDTFSPRAPFLAATVFVIFGLGLAFLLKMRTIQNKSLQKI